MKIIKIILTFGVSMCDNNDLHTKTLGLKQASYKKYVEQIFNKKNNQ